MKHILKVLLFGTGLGILLVILQQSLSIDSKTFMQYYWMVTPAIIIGAALINCIYFVFYFQKMKRLEKLFRLERFSEYVDGVNKLLQTAKGKYLRSILAINLIAGYLEMEQFDTAIQMLEDIPVKQLKGHGLKAAYYINLCECYIKNGKVEKALAAYCNHENLFARYRNSASYGTNIALLDIEITICKGEYERARSLLCIAQETWREPRFQATIQKLTDAMNQADIIFASAKKKQKDK